MLQIQYIRENKQKTIEGLQKKWFKAAEESVHQVLTLDDQRKHTQFELDNSLAEANKLAKEIGELMKNGKKQDAEIKKQLTTELKTQAKNLTETIVKIEKELFEVLVKIPNIPHESVPVGKTPEENEVVASFGSIPALNENALPHWEIIKKYDIIDFELGNKITGAGFPVYKGKGARLQRGLINFFLNEATNAGYMEVQPPILINEASGFGTGQLPDKEGQMYFVTEDNLFLVPTAEVPITNLYRDVLLKKDELPIKNTGYTPCFRREAGSWGAHVRGLNRLHQFDKVEIVQLVEPQTSYQVLDDMVEHVKNLLTKLELPFRILRLCGGDMSFGSALTYDFEVFSAAQKRWLEVSSVSNFETFQSNRLKCRFKNEEGKNQLVHTLNGSAMALPRIVAALLENNQTNSEINIPKVLHSYLGFESI
jgi:seryl-tRNA synthetase